MEADSVNTHTFALCFCPSPAYNIDLILEARQIRQKSHPCGEGVGAQRKRKAVNQRTEIKGENGARRGGHGGGAAFVSCPKSIGKSWEGLC